MAQPITHTPRLIDIEEVMRRTRLKKTYIYMSQAAGTFPKSLKLPGTRAVAWLSSDIDAWIAKVLQANNHQPFNCELAVPQNKDEPR